MSAAPTQQAGTRYLPRHPTLSIAVCVLALGGCATFSADGGFGPVEQSARARVDKDVAWVRTDAEREQRSARVAELLGKPLSADDAVQVALLNNRGLQAAFHELGIAEADVVQAGRLPNPGFRFGRLQRGDEVEHERGIHFNLARLLAAPLMQQLESRRFEQTQATVSMQVLSLAFEARKAYINAVAADESVRYLQQVKTAAEASAELARRMASVGNWNRLQQAREQGFYADAALNLARAERAKVAAREKLTRLMGLWGTEAQFQLPERLPDLTREASELPDIEQRAMAERLDVQAAKAGTEQLARNLGLTRTTRFVNVLELGVVRNSSNQLPTQRGYEVSLELPLFDWGGARVAKAEALYMQAIDRAAETAVNARSQVREAYLAYRTSHDIARHYRDEIVPLRKRIADENLLRYNGMLIGVFDLLADARSQIASVNSYIESLRDFWLAQADLDMALIGPPATTVMPSASTPMLEAGAAAH
jgi:outer membrane protein TolC